MNGDIIFSNEVIMLRKLLKYLKAYTKECIIAPLFKMLEASFELLIPLVVAAIVDTGIATGNRGYVLKMCAVRIFSKSGCGICFPFAPRGAEKGTHLILYTD